MTLKLSEPKQLTLSVNPLLRPKQLNPLADVDYEDNIETDAPKEMSALLRAFRERAAKEKKRFKEATDTEYWFAMCFQTHEQKDAFLRAMDWLQHGDTYIDGAKIARQMKNELPTADVRYQGEKVDVKMAALPYIETK